MNTSRCRGSRATGARGRRYEIAVGGVPPEARRARRAQSRRGGVNVGCYPISLGLEGRAAIGVESNPKMCRLLRYAIRRLALERVGALDLAITPETVRMRSTGDLVIFLSLWHHLVRTHGLDQATYAPRSPAAATETGMLFQTGEPRCRTATASPTSAATLPLQSSTSSSGTARGRRSSTSASTMRSTTRADPAGGTHSLSGVRHPRTSDAPADVAEWVVETLGELGLTVTACEMLGAGKEAVVRKVSSRAVDGRHFHHVLKSFRPERRFNSVSSVRAEFEALVAFARRLEATDTNVVCPVPVALGPDGLSYLMGYVGGEQLDDRLVRLRRDPAAQVALAAQIVQGLVHFYDAVGVCYADFHPANVRVTSSCVCLLDPLIGNPGFLPPRDSLRWWPSSADTGFWVQGVTTTVLKQSVQRPALAAVRMAFARRLVRRAAETFAPRELGGFRAEVRKAAEFHLARFRRQQGPRWALHCYVGCRLAYRALTDPGLE